jgi:hypothetical protein
MENLELQAKELKNGFRYTILRNGTEIGARKSKNTYVAASIFVLADDTNRIMEILYHGRMDLVGKGDSGRYMKITRLKFIGVATIKNPQQWLN